MQIAFQTFKETPGYVPLVLTEPVLQGLSSLLGQGELAIGDAERYPLPMDSEGSGRPVLRLLCMPAEYLHLGGPIIHTFPTLICSSIIGENNTERVKEGARR